MDIDPINIMEDYEKQIAAPPLPPRSKQSLVFVDTKSRSVTITAVTQDFKIDVTSEMAEKIGEKFVGIVGSPALLGADEHCLVKNDRGYTWYTCVTEKQAGWITTGEVKTVVEVGFYTLASYLAAEELERKCELLETNNQLIRDKLDREKTTMRQEKTRREDAELLVRELRRENARAQEELSSLRSEVVENNKTIAHLRSLLVEKLPAAEKLPTTEGIPTTERIPTAEKHPTAEKLPTAETPEIIKMPPPNDYPPVVPIKGFDINELKNFDKRRLTPPSDRDKKHAAERAKILERFCGKMPV